MSNERHTTSAFDRDLESLQALVMRMGGPVEVATRDTAQAIYLATGELPADFHPKSDRTPFVASVSG